MPLTIFSKNRGRKERRDLCCIFSRDEIDRVSDLPREQTRPLPALHLPSSEREPRDENRRRRHHGQVDERALTLHGDPLRKERPPKDQKQIAEIAPHDVSHRDVDLSAERRDNADRQLWKRRSDRDESESDHQFAHPDHPRDRDGASDESLRARDEEGEPEDELT